MDCLWATGQAGIVIEILGAGTIVISAFRSSRKIRQHKTDIDHVEDAIKQLMEDTRNQFKTQSIGFALLVIGLTMQFVGGFSR